MFSFFGFSPISLLAVYVVAVAREERGGGKETNYEKDAVGQIS